MKKGIRTRHLVYKIKALLYAGESELCYYVTKPETDIEIAQSIYQKLARRSLIEGLEIVSHNIYHDSEYMTCLHIEYRDIISKYAFFHKYMIL